MEWVMSDNGCAAVDLVVVGAGFAGLYMLHKARGLGFSTRAFERGDDVGGTWYWNRYPGARCDVQSLEYSYSFDEDLDADWTWTERFATQPEILSYLRHVADRFDLRRHIDFETELTGGHYDEARHRWIVQTSRGETVEARFLVMATGNLSTSQIPPFPGLEGFQGDVYHTGRWPHDPVDFAGKRVGVIGNGSSGIQAIPVIAQEAGHLFAFQRSAAFTLPARNQPLSDEKRRHWRENVREIRRQAREELPALWHHDPAIGTASQYSAEQRDREYARRWENGGSDLVFAFSDIASDLQANATAAEFVKAKIREIVADPAVARLLTPEGYPIAAKRICIDTDYYATFNRDNVTLVDVKTSPITGFTADAIETSDQSYPLDAIVFATGYDAMTGALTRLDLTGAGGARLEDKWDAGPANYLGIMTTAFPNFFMITGPGSPSVLTNVVMSIEQHVEWLADLLSHMRRHDLVEINPTDAAEAAWVDHCRELAKDTLFMKVNSWYLGANIPGKPRVFMPFIGGAHVYRQICAEVAAEDYRGFAFTASDGHRLAEKAPPALSFGNAASDQSVAAP
jgi:cyclohexanone monooxygenase